jgi:hypothetical protein
MPQAAAYRCGAGFSALEVVVEVEITHLPRASTGLVDAGSGNSLHDMHDQDV